MSIVNRHYKDRLFRSLFAAEENRGELLKLYNALNGSNYQNPSELAITTIENVIYMGMKNDLSYLLDSYMVLYEHQSTYNPNMPLRGLIYFGKLYEEYTAGNNLNLYSKKLTKLPTPKYYVFYNGTEELKDRVQLKLSDAFIHPASDGSFEWTAELININASHNKELMAACRILNEYAEFVEMVRVTQRNHPGMTIESVMELVVDTSIRKGILVRYLQKNKSEVIGMLLTEYNEEKTLNAIRKEEREEGREEGRKEGREEGREEGRKEGREEERKKTKAGIAAALLKKGMEFSEIAEIVSEPTETVKEWLQVHL